LTTQDIWDDLWGSPDEPEVPIKSSYNSNHLARYFQDKLFAAPWYSGFGMVNLRALAGALAKWKSKTDSDTVRAMMDRYMEDASLRGKNPGWQDFLYNSERIAQHLKPVVVKDKWDLLEEEWENNHGSSS